MSGNRLILSFVFCVVCCVVICFAEEVVPAKFAGSFYPDNPKELEAMIKAFLDKADPKAPEGEIFGLISPHAGYGFSGEAAAFGYKLIKGKSYKTVVIVGSSHQFSFNGASVYPEGAFRTPFGNLEVDKAFAARLLDKDKEIFFEPAAFSEEHSVEVQLPFLQKVLSNFRIVPIVLGDCTLLQCQKLAALLKEAIGKRKDVLVIASSDLYHGYDFRECEEADKLTLAQLKKMDAEGLYYGLREGRFQMCGGFGAVTLLTLAKELGHERLDVLKYTNSALVTGRKQSGIWAVGYASCVIDQEEGAKPMLNNKQKKKLLRIARQSIETYLKTGNRLELSETDPALTRETGAFVTLHEKGQLRGCIGSLVGSEPLYLTIRDMAVEAAVKDPRFAPLEAQELKGIEIEISVLSPLERVPSADKIKLGEHGVLVRKGISSGVFLPQVATETGWSKEEFLSYLCEHKAGLPADAWKDKSTELWVFTADIFSEKGLESVE